MLYVHTLRNWSHDKIKWSTSSIYNSLVISHDSPSNCASLAIASWGVSGKLRMLRHLNLLLIGWIKWRFHTTFFLGFKRFSWVHFSFQVTRSVSFHRKYHHLQLAFLYLEQNRTVQQEQSTYIDFSFKSYVDNQRD